MELSNRQTEIIEKSIEIIANKGIQGLTIKNLSKEIGISEPAIYRHFASKVDILLAILDSFNQMSEMFSDIMETFEGSAIEKIRFMFSKMIDVFSETPSLVSVIFSEEIFKNETVLKNQVIEIQNRNQKTVEMIIDKGKKEKNVRTDVDNGSLALIIMGSLRLLVKNWNLNAYGFCLQKEGKKLIHSIDLILKP
jgi:AcrR family transcriptional regulator